MAAYGSGIRGHARPCAAAGQRVGGGRIAARRHRRDRRLLGQRDPLGLQQRPYRDDQLALAVHPGHPLAGHGAIAFGQTLDFEHVGLPPATAVCTMLQQAAARAGRPLRCRVVVSNFDAALRVVAADLGVSVIPQQVSVMHAARGLIEVIPLTDAWARRRVAVGVGDAALLAPAAARLADFLVAQAAPDGAA